ncbi:MAG: alpha/beta fold hydrolase, partial [Nocardioides sp.]|nr:alpha/beta fold hydrolase [Nocardioides sp.]
MRTSLGLIAVAALVGAGFTTAGAQAASAQPVTDHAAPGKASHAAHPTSDPSSDYTPPPIQWGQCPTASLQNAGAVCGMLTVPLDYAHPDGTKIQLAVSKIAHKTSDAAAQGPMLVNPGGPGGSGLGLARLGAFVPNGGGDPYDWIGFDPRGVGRSVPQLSCDGDYFAAGRPSYDPAAGTTQFWLAKAAAYAGDCEASAAQLLRHDHTTDWVADMESIRKALGADKINYYGFSYGTYLGQVY